MSNKWTIEVKNGAGNLELEVDPVNKEIVILGASRKPKIDEINALFEMAGIMNDQLYEKMRCTKL